MNRKIPDQLVDEIRARSDIVELITSYLPLKRAGVNFKACCPFHQEKTPSFTVNPQRQSYHCFGCGKGGDVFRFVMEKEGVDFPNAIHILARRCGVVIPERSEPGENEAQTRARLDQREQLYELHQKIQDWYARNLWENPNSPVARYLAGRGLPEELARRFGLGAAPDSWDAALSWGRRNGFSDADMLTAGILTENPEKPGHCYDRFRNRLMFPIWNEQGRVVAFSARTIEKDFTGGKYVNSPETPIFKKSRVLYALSLARAEIQQRGFAILCEGQLDVIAMHRAGFPNAVAPQGTAFTDEQARILKRYTERLHLAFDADSAGIKATARAAELTLPVGFELKVISFPGGKDPDELFKAAGPEPIANAVASAKDVMDFLFESLSAGVDLGSAASKGRLAGELVKYVSLVSNSVARSSYTSQIAARLHIPEQAVFQELNKLKNSQRPLFQQETQSTVTSLGNNKPEMPDADDKVAAAEESLLSLALAHGTIAKRLEEELPSEMISQGVIGKALELLIQASANGEWSEAATSLHNDPLLGSDPRITRILVQESTESSPEFQEKMFSDCIRSIKVHHLERESRRLQAAHCEEQDPDRKRQLFVESDTCRKKLIALRKGKA